MPFHTIVLGIVLSLIGLSVVGPCVLRAGEVAPWGQAAPAGRVYKPQKVVFDVVAGDIKGMESVLDRASYLSVITGADPFESSVVLVIHGDAIPLFAGKNFSRYEALMRRAQSLTVGDTIKLRLCESAAKLGGFKPGDFHGFVEMVPMAEAEISRLQTEEGHAYLR